MQATQLYVVLQTGAIQALKQDLNKCNAHASSAEGAWTMQGSRWHHHSRGPNEH